MAFLKMLVKHLLILSLLWINISFGHTTQRPNRDGNDDDDSNPFIDMASAFITDALSQQNGNSGSNGLNMNGGGAGLAASLIGAFMQANGSGAKSSSGGGQDSSAAILSGIGSIIAGLNAANNNNNKNGRSSTNSVGFDPSLIGNIIEMFTTSSDNNNNNNNNNNRNNNVREKRNINNKSQQEQEDSGIGLESIIQIASAFMNNQPNSNQGPTKSQKNNQNSNNDNNFMTLLPMIFQAINSFNGPEGQQTQEKHKDHAWVLPPFLEQIHVLWDHFSNSELANALWQKSGIHTIFKGFTGRDGRLDYNKLFESLNNQSFRRRWIKAATLYLADWANYIAEPEVYQRYFQTAQIMLNGFLKSQGYPKTTYFDPNRPSETITSLLNHIAKTHLSIKVDTRDYVKPAVSYTKELLKLGQSRGLLQKFNSTELSDKLTDTLNLEVIEPVLKVHRAYRFATENPQCDKYVLCELNSHDPNEKLGLPGIKSGITKVGSMTAAWFVSTETGTPFWNLFGVINEPYNCQAKYPYDCTGFHEGEAKVTTEYIHNEL
ncbi:ras guanine nucleotide exchange factor L [Condylostylus longicornis]|uniref:ras guanine nucleotide exchange factor L n=1 Tax=Condylostylus longicornis TaxID=2530218 RepID=UPI00244DB3B5|nr:ras guanine nucleotide exchange factor L [Condylostylus longicornis]